MTTVQKPNKRHLFCVVALSVIVSFALVGCWAEAIPVPHPTSTYGFAQCPGDVNSFYIIGGRDEWDSPLDHLLRYDVSEEIWYRLAPLPQPAIAPAATCYGDKIFVVTYDQHLYQYDILSNIWTEASPPPRAALGAAVGAWDGKLYLVSGSPMEWDTPVLDVDIYEITTDNWLPAAGQSIPEGTILSGYVQAGPYLFVVGGFGENSPSQNVSATQRYDMSSDTWELGPTFSSSRAAFALAVVGRSLFAIGGDMDGGDYLDETTRVDNLDLTDWPAGTWVEDGNPLPQALMFNSSGFCSMALTAGEVWSVGGAYPDWDTMNVVSINQYYDNTEGESGRLGSLEGYELPDDLNFTSRGIEALGNCLLGSYGLNFGPDSQTGVGLPGTPVTYTLSLANTGDIPDAYDLSISSDWTTTVAGLDPVWSGTSVDLIVTVDIPQDAMPDDMDVAEITLVSRGDPALSHTVQITTSRFVGVFMEPPSSSGVDVPGNTLVYPITLYNGTGQTNSFDLTLSPYRWGTELTSDQLGPIPDAGSEAFTVSVTIPPDAGWNLTDTVYITATSLLNQNRISYNDVVTVTSRSYAPPQISISPEMLESTQFVDEVVTQTLSIGNGNGLDLTFKAYAGTISDAILLMHFDEPFGTTTFSDSSGNGNDGTCSGDTCPAAGVEGMLGTSLFFDGDDYILVTDNPSLNPQDSIAISAWIYVEDWNGNRRILQKGDGDTQYRFMAENGAFHLDLYQVGRVTTNLPTSGEWHHVLGQYDGSMMQIWIDGQLSAEIPATGTIATTADPLHIGTKYAGAPAGDYFYGRIDELQIFNRSLSPAEIMSLYHGGISVDWLSVDPITGTVPANKALPVEVIFDAMDLQPDVYTTTLLIVNNDPLNSLAQVPITMTVEPTHGMGWVEGMVTDQRSGNPLEATLIAYGQPYTLTSDTETGYYKFWLEQGTYTVEVSAPGYVPQTAEVGIIAQQGITQDFALLLDAPWMQLTPSSLSVTQTTGAITTHTLTISNTGNHSLAFEVYGGTSTGSVLLMPLDEPDGSTVFHDVSGYAHNGFCQGLSCPIAGIEGRYGKAINFDGVDDSVSLPDNAFDILYTEGEISISAWMKTSLTGDRTAVMFEGHWLLYFDAAEPGVITGVWDGVWQNRLSSGAFIADDQFHHVVSTYSGGVASIYVDGILRASAPRNIANGITNQLSGGYFNFYQGTLDEVMLFDRALTDREVQNLYHAGPDFSSSSWLTVTPISGTVPIAANQVITSLLNATDLQPDIYTSTLYILSNDPLFPVQPLPVTMTVEPTASMGWMEGTVTDLRTGAPLEATLIAQGQPYTVTSDAETGFYQFWLEQGAYTIEVSAQGYVTQTAEVDIRARQGISQDFALLLDAPWMQVAPENLENSQLINEIVTQTLTITNSGPVSLTFQTYAGVLSDAVLLLHLDEPAGATTFVDASGNGYNGECTGDSCPTSGIVGAVGTALQFDGNNDFVEVPHNSTFDNIEILDRITIAAWVNIFEWYNDWFLIADKYELSNDGGYNFAIYATQINFMGVSCYTVPNLNEWHHIAVSYDRAQGIMSFFLDGGLACEVNTTVDIPDTYGEPLYIGYDPTGGDEYSNGLLDEVVIYDHTLTSEEIELLYSLGIDNPSSWFSIDPISGVVPSESTMPIRATFDATDLQPDVYTTTLLVLSNDPLNARTQIPVTMTVAIPASYGHLEGTIANLGYCDGNPGPLDEAQIIIASSTGMTWTMTSDELGAYGYWLDEIGSPYTLTVTKPGYEIGVVDDVIIVGQGTTTLDFDLRWLVPCMSLAPDTLPLSLEMGMTGTQTLALTNLGGGGASFEMIERDHGRNSERGAELVELTIPSAPDFPPEGSAVEAGPYTPRSERVMTIERRPTLSEPVAVLLLHADDGDGQWIKDQLLAYGDLGEVDAYNARFETPGLDDLLPYDVVLTWTNYKYQDPIAIGDLLADYVDRGGKVINLMYALGSHGWEMKGRFMSENYTAMNGGLVEYSTACIGDTNPTHPILEGVTYVCEFYRLKDTFLTPGSSVVARWDDNELFVAANGESTVISIAGYVGYYFRWTGQMDLLVHNAIQWLALGYGIPWLITDPITGTVSADNGITTVEVFFDSLNYQPEVFRADLIARSNDPYKPDLQVPVTMTVEPTASMGWVEGIITDLRTGAPLEATIIAYGQPYTVTSDAESGFYQFWLEQGAYTIQISAPGYVTQTATVEITAQQGITQDIALLLDAPWMQVAPEVLESTQRVNQVVTQTLVLTNTGAAALDFELLLGTGLPLHIVSDDNWRVSNMLEPGWETVDFDDASWEFSVAPAPVNCGTINCWSDPNVFSMWSEIQYQTIYLRRSFSVGSGVISATIKTECDDDHDLYLNGVLVASDWNGYAGPTIITGVTDYVHPGENVIAIKARDTAGGCRILCVDATILTEGIDWLSVLPASGTIPANSSLPVQVSFDATDLQPDLYTTTLLIVSNDPLNSLVQIPVTMTVQEDEPISGLSVGNDGPTLLGNPTTLFASVVTGTNVTYEWAFGDGTSGSGAEATHIYPHEGSFQAVVTATNSISQLSAATQVDVLPSGYRQYLPFIPWGAGRPVSGETGVFPIWLSTFWERYWW